MSFSANTMRVRWLCGHEGSENNVMPDRRLPISAIRSFLQGAGF
jgi:hypothetical protein